MPITKIQAESMNLADTYAFTGTVSGAGGGKIGQVVQNAFSNAGSITSTSWVNVNSNINTSITPTATSSKILISLSLGVYPSNGYLSIFKDSSNLFGNNGFLRMYTNNDTGVTVSFNYLDSPSTTSSVTYMFYARLISGTFYYNNDVEIGTMTLQEVLA